MWKRGENPSEMPGWGTQNEIQKPQEFQRLKIVERIKVAAWEWASLNKIWGDLTLTFPKVWIPPAVIAHYRDVHC